MVSYDFGKPVFKCQRVGVQIRPTFDTSICTELKGIAFLMGYAVACAGPGMFARFWEGGPLFSRWSTC